MSQKEKIKKHLLKKSITTIEAFEKYKITRLSAHIHILRKEGLIIEGKRMENKKEGTWWFKYTYKGVQSLKRY
jgi:hypothetical protein